MSSYPEPATAKGCPKGALTYRLLKELDALEIVLGTVVHQTINSQGHPICECETVLDGRIVERDRKKRGEKFINKEIQLVRGVIDAAGYRCESNGDKLKIKWRAMRVPNSPFF